MSTDQRSTAMATWGSGESVSFPDSASILQHRPETTWPAARASFAPVHCGLRNVFLVPGA